MIGVKLQGRLGNQLFQFAFAYNLSKKLNKNFYLDTRLNKFYLYKYFILTPPLINILISIVEGLKGRKIVFFLLNMIERKGILKSLIIKNDSQPRVIYNNLGDKVLYDGYFQSEYYFKEAKEDIKEIYKIKRKFKKEFNEKYLHIFQNNKVIAIHIRLTDYKTHGNEVIGYDVSIPFHYYESQLAEIPCLNTYKVFFVSDDIIAVKEHFGSKPNFIYDKNCEIIDFQILLNSDILIISNSTFAWWGAYLNKKVNKKVYAPKYWLGFKAKKEYPDGIMNDNFTWVDINQNL